MTNTPIIAAVLAPFILWRVYQRTRRLMTRQRSQLWRHWIGATLFPLLVVALALAAQANPIALAALAAGALGGAALGVIGLRTSRFEHSGGQFFYTPNAHIGLAVALLFIGRLLYRAYAVYALGAAPSQDFSRSPLTLLVFGLLAGYYTVYASGLLRWRQRASLAVNELAP
jgi:hypothetical protein